MVYGDKTGLKLSLIDWLTIAFASAGIIANAGFTIIGIVSRYEFHKEFGILGFLISVALAGAYLIIFSFITNDKYKSWVKILVFIFGWGTTFVLDFYASLLGTVAVEKLVNISSSDWVFRWLIALFVTSCGSGVAFYISQKIPKNN
jgi:hypothetical protein